MMESCIISSTSLDDKIQSLAANIRTLEDANSAATGVVARQLALELTNEISIYVKSFKIKF